MSGLWGSAAPFISAFIAERLRRPLLYVTAHLNQADDARDDIETFSGRPAELLPAWETVPGEGAGSGEIAAERTRLCANLIRSSESGAEPTDTDARSSIPILVAPIQALMQPVPSPAGLDANTLTFRVNQEVAPERITRWLVDRGFEGLDQVEQPGDFALRGGILDIFASADTDPIRIEFFGDRIESIRRFEPGSQRSVNTIDATRITLPPDPAAAAPTQTTSLLNYLPAETLIVLHEPVETIEVAKIVLDRLANPVGHYPIDAILEKSTAFQQLFLSRFPTAAADDADSYTLSCETPPNFESNSADAVQQLVSIAEDENVVVYCDNLGEQQRLREMIDQCLQLAAKTGDTKVRQPKIEMKIGQIHQGFRWCPATDRPTDAGRTLTVLPHHELFHRYTQKRRMRKVAATRPIDSFIDLAEGDYVVHVIHGIGRYIGMKTMRKGDSKKSEEYLTLRFADKAVIHVPVSQIDLVQKYIGSGAARPILSKLGGTRWQSTKQKVEDAVADLAADLLRIQAVRESQPGIAFPQDTRWQTEFENAFLYTETPDQVTTIKDIKSDMARPRPMDRLICGDVGYGKTELAMRAAFKVVEFGRQVAVLVPTTVLAEQHYRTFSERMVEYPFVIDRLNRFRSARKQREIINDAKKGRIDILIGTHRIVSKDVDFANLGLVIIDEEQRFGVEHKERLKRLRVTVDVLTLTATPIPRTLHMSMIGLRDISSLATPPMDRRAISTRVTTWNDDLIREALVRELNREGQVFFVHNRVHSIETFANRIRALVPDARVIVGHGQMPGDQLEEVMLRFIKHDADVLVSTNIIESGLDIPNANTILIDRADRFGLADLHQLRGRVGRYKHRAYCYLLLSPNRPITSTAAKRLKAIEQYSELGAGFRIAMRDLEIRGAGNLLGQEQSGNIAAVGYELYCQLLEKSVKRMKGEPYHDRVAVHLELDVEARIPKSYIASDRQRMECYRRIAACHTAQDVDQLTKDLKDAFGRYPVSVDTLLTLAEIKVRAAAWNIQTIIKKEPDLIFQIEGQVRKLEPLFADTKGQTSFPDPNTLYWRLPDNYFHGNTLLTILRSLFRKAAQPRDKEKMVGTAELNGA
ncbi:MAG: transcription-repair coupling factor [Planctomycetota bacterium]|nr:transcription-repair coupling factor [Planctomycetota bacterium]